MSDNTIGKWKGITADDDGRVTAIDLWVSFLRGAIPPGPGDPDRPFCRPASNTEFPDRMLKTDKWRRAVSVERRITAMWGIVE